jgi:hypothetical protein
VTALVPYTSAMFGHTVMFTFSYGGTKEQVDAVAPIVESRPAFQFVEWS